MYISQSGKLGKGTLTEGAVVLSENLYKDEYVKKICANETCAYYSKELNIIQSHQKVYVSQSRYVREGNNDWWGVS